MIEVMSLLKKISTNLPRSERKVLNDFKVSKKVLEKKISLN